jgi:hypothetical protein
MADFITNNYQWLFSGLGVAIILFVIKIFFPKKKKILNNNSNNNVIVTGDYSNVQVSDSFNSSSIKNKITTNPDQESQIDRVKKEDDTEIKSFKKKDIIDISLKSIKQEVERSPIILQDAAWKNYEGIVIRCKLNLVTIYLKQNNNADVIFMESGLLGPMVNVNVCLDTFPFLKIAKNNSTFEITGRITECSLLRIKLNPVIIKQLNKNRGLSLNDLSERLPI